MKDNFFASTLRGMRKNKLNAFINIGGLAISLAACMLITVFIRRELAYDTTHPDADRIFRLAEMIDSGSNLENSASSPFPTTPAMAGDYSDFIESYVRIFNFQVPIKSLKLDNNDMFSETGVYYADSTLFEMFDLPLIDGDPSQVLNRPMTIVLSEELAKKYYGDENPVGKTIRMAGSDDFRCEITGVFKLGGPSHFQPRAVLSMSSAEAVAPHIAQNWVWNPCWTYLKLAPGVSMADMEAQFPDFVQKYYPERTRDMTSHYLQRIQDIHLHSALEFEMSKNSDIKYVYIFACCALFLLIVAAVNFINLTTAGLTARIKEVGVRKVSGATRLQLVRQFLLESLVTTGFAFFLATTLVVLTFSSISKAFQLDLSLSTLLDPGFVGIMVGLVLVTGLLSGLYPALVLSRVNVITVFKGGLSGSKGGKRFRRALVTFQFGISVVLIVFTIVSRKQLNFMQDRDQGYETENILILTTVATPLPGQLSAFKQEVMKNQSVLGVTVTNELLGVNNNNHEFSYDGVAEGEWQYFPALMVDEEFNKALGIEIIAGRDYDPIRQREDSFSIVVNRALTEYLGYEKPEDALGERLNSMSGYEKIIGVTENFNYKSVHHPVGPLVLDVEDRRSYHFHYFAKNLVIRVADMDESTLAHLEATWGQFVQSAPFDYRLLDQEIKSLYSAESKLTTVLGIFSGLAVLVACLGLFALTHFIARRKTKEIALRKVLGASLPNLLTVASKEQMALVALSLVLAFPVALWLVNQWMQAFAFRTEIGLMPFVTAGLLAIMIALLTIFFLALRAARKEPAPVLKYE